MEFCLLNGRGCESMVGGCGEFMLFERVKVKEFDEDIVRGSVLIVKSQFEVEWTS